MYTGTTIAPVDNAATRAGLSKMRRSRLIQRRTVEGEACICPSLCRVTSPKTASCCCPARCLSPSQAASCSIRRPHQTTTLSRIPHNSSSRLCARLYIYTTNKVYTLNTYKCVKVILEYCFKKEDKGDKESQLLRFYVYPTARFSST